jgi:hypothetical protein
MRRALGRFAVAMGTLAAALGARPAVAQVTTAADAGLVNAYVFRGVTLTNRFVVQPDASVTVGAGGGSLLFTGWANIDAGRYDNPATDISEAGGQSSLKVTEIDLVSEYTHPLVSKLNGTVGGIAYLYPNGPNSVSPGLFTNAVNRTAEIYGKLLLVGVPLSPRVQLWYDVVKVKGAYIETAVTQTLPTGSVPVTLGALAGFSAGQGINASDPSQVANFSGNGLTHVDLSAAAGIAAGPVTLSPTVHFYLLKDAFTKVTEPGVTHDVKLTAGVTLSWSKAFLTRPATRVE